MAESKKSIYLESSIFSFLCAAPSSVESTRKKQQDTHKFWADHRHDFDLVVSDEVIVEISVGDPDHANQRLALANPLKMLLAVAEDRILAQSFVNQKLIPGKALVDATHLAIAVREKIDILMTWNLRHLANRQVLPLVYNFLATSGRHLPAIMTPSDLMESP